MGKKFYVFIAMLAIAVWCSAAGKIKTTLFNAIDRNHIDRVITKPTFVVNKNVPEDKTAFIPASIISDNMVLQRNAVNHLWGQTNFDGPFAVEIAGHLFYGKAKNHSFDIYLAPLRVCNSCLLTFYNDKAKLVIRNVAIGEVFLLSGQSNITYAMKDVLHGDQGCSFGVYKPSLAADPETFYTYGKDGDAYQNWNKTVSDKNKALLEDNSLVRLCMVEDEDVYPDKPEVSVPCKWYESNTKTDDASKRVSAIAYYFAKEMQHKTGIPVGVVPSSRGGTLVVPWIPMDVYSQHKDCFYYIGDESNAYNLPSKCYNHFIAPITKYKFKAVIWWQGDGQPIKWVDGMNLLVDSWRKAFDEKTLPFYVLENDRSGEADTIPADYAKTRITTVNQDEDFGTLDSWPECRANVQKLCAQKSFCYYIVNLDTGGYDECHSSWDKDKVADRCVKTFFKYGYGMDMLLSPVIKSLKVTDKGILLTLAHVGKGIVVKNNGRNFDIKIHGVWKPARAYKMNSNQLIIKARDTKLNASDYEYLRYGYRNFPRISRRVVWSYLSVYNSSDMPLDQFIKKINR